MTPVQKLAGLTVLILVLMTGAAGAAWQVQDWRMGKKLAEQAMLHGAHLATIGNAANTQVQVEHEKRLGLEKRVQSIDEAHFKEFSDAQKNISNLRDRLATSDLRLSVLLDATDSASGFNVPTAPGAVGVVHAARRAQLDPAHAQRIIAITDAGDQGLIALRACQAYAKEVSNPK